MTAAAGWVGGIRPSRVPSAEGRGPTAELTGLRKAAILCMTLGREKAAEIMNLLAAHEVEVLGREIAVTTAVEPAIVHSVLVEFRGVFQAAEAAASGGVIVARGILERALGPQRAKVVLDKIQEQIADTGLRRLKNAAPELLMSVLHGEHPQTIALILAHLSPRQAAKVIAAMDPGLAGDVLYRVARMDKISPEMLGLVEQGLTSKTDLSLNHEMTRSGGPSTVAEMLNLTGGPLEKTLLEAIERKSQELSTQVKNLMFVFEDLKLLDGRAMQRLLREVDAKDVALALKAASEELKQHIYASMPERAASMLQEEVEVLGPVRVREVEAAHTRVIEVMRSLEEQGEIIVSRRGGDENVIA